MRRSLKVDSLPAIAVVVLTDARPRWDQLDCYSNPHSLSPGAVWR